MYRFLCWVQWIYFTVITALLLSPGVPRLRRFGEEVDEYTHFIVFLLLGLLFELTRRKKGFEFWAVFLTLYSIGSELMQGILSPFFYRTCGMQDLVQDLAGVQFGMILSLICRYGYNKFRKHNNSE
ncbi:hypothetical protein FACS189419_07250 [Planctomycetales bacterium]|nr:hypothetical protein FACS189419_07250 [Planctomycetales bacterium]